MKRILLGLFFVAFSCVAMPQKIYKKIEEGSAVKNEKIYKLVWAILLENSERVERLLSLNSYARIARDHRFQNGRTLLHLAILPGCNTQEGHMQRMRIVKTLLEKGASPERRDYQEESPVDLLKRCGDVSGKQEMQELLTQNQEMD